MSVSGKTNGERELSTRGAVRSKNAENLTSSLRNILIESILLSLDLRGALWWNRFVSVWCGWLVRWQRRSSWQVCTDEQGARVLERQYQDSGAGFLQITSSSSVAAEKIGALRTEGVSEE